MKPRLFTTSLVAISTLVLVSTAWTKDKDPKLTKLVGVVSKIADDGSWQVKGMQGKKGKWQIRVGSKAKFYSYAMVPFSKVQTGETVHVLGRYQKEQPGSGFGTRPPEMIAIQAIVCGAKFEPPKLNSKQKGSSLQWRKGKLRKPKNESNYFLGPVKLQATKSTEVVLGKKTDKSTLEKRSIAYFSGIEDGEKKKKPKKLLADMVRVLGPKVYKSKKHLLLFPM